MLRDAVVILAGYLLGSLPFAFVVTKALSGKDVRVEGEGNVGLRNAHAVAGPWAGLLVYLVLGRLLKSFVLVFGLAALVFYLLTLPEGNDVEGLIFIVCFVGLAGLKKLIDLPYERAVQARAGRV